MQKLSKIVKSFVILLIVVLLFPNSKIKAQEKDSTHLSIDTTNNTARPKSFLRISDSLNKKRVWLAAGGISGIAVASYTGLYYLWYANYPRSSFKFIDDMGEWNQFDKVSHMQGAYSVTMGLDHIFKWTGMKSKKATILAGIFGLAEHTTIEVFDGFSAEWGASVGDFVFNAMGSGLYVAQELAWNKQIVKMKYAFHGSENIQDPIVLKRANQLFGSGFIGREMKNYNGANVWFSVATCDLFPKQKKMKWFAVALGYGAGGMYGGFENKWKTTVNGVDTTYDYTALIPRYRRFLIAPDIDLEKIPVKQPGWKMLFSVLNIFKWPSPALEINTKGEIIFYPIYEMGFNVPLYLKK